MTDLGVPQNTVVVLPKTLPMNRGAFWTLFWTVGLLMGLFARSLIGEVSPSARPTDTSSRSNAASVASDTGEAPGTAPAQEIRLRAVLELPTATPTGTPTPTAIPTRDPVDRIDFCGTPTPGTLCKVPKPPAPTPTPYPACEDVVATPANAGDWCVWAGGSPVADGVFHAGPTPTATTVNIYGVS